MGRERIRRSPGRRILRGVAIALLCYVILSFAATPLALRLMFPRTETSDPAALADLQQVTFPSGGNTLRGYLLEAEDPAGVVLLLHGMGGDASQMASVMRLFADRGWSVLAIDMTGVGQSEGDGTGGLQQGLPDGRAALDWIETQPQWDGLPVVACGHSAGGWAAGMLSEDSRVSGAICLAAFDRPVAQMLYWAERYTGPLAWLGNPFLRLWEAIYYGAESDASASEAVAGCGKPVLVIQGSADEVVLPEMSLYTYLAGEDSDATVMLAEGVSHAGADLWETLASGPIDSFLGTIR